MAVPLHRTGRIPQDTFGTRLAIIRQAMGWSASKAAFNCGDLGEQNWRNWEDGKRPRDYEAVCHRIAAATGFDLDWIMRGGPLEPQNWKEMSRPDLRVLPGSGSSDPSGRRPKLTVVN